MADNLVITFSTDAPVRFAPVSFALGALAALPELAGARVFRRCRPLRDRLQRMAPASGRFLDGYDAVSGIAIRRALKSGAIS